MAESVDRLNHVVGGAKWQATSKEMVCVIRARAPAFGSPRTRVRAPRGRFATPGLDPN